MAYDTQPAVRTQRQRRIDRHNEQSTSAAWGRIGGRRSAAHRSPPAHSSILLQRNWFSSPPRCLYLVLPCLCRALIPPISYTVLGTRVFGGDRLNLPSNRDTYTPSEVYAAVFRARAPQTANHRVHVCCVKKRSQSSHLQQEGRCKNTEILRSLRGSQLHAGRQGWCSCKSSRGSCTSFLAFLL